MTISDTQSYSDIIRDALFAKAVTLPFFQGFVVRRSKQLQVQPQYIPYLGVYIIDEVMGPDGDLNAGHIRFRHALRLGFSVIIQNNDPVESELKLDEAFWALMNGLWRDAKLTNFLQSSMPDNARFEGIERGTRKHIWGSAGLNNETPFGELQYEPLIIYRAEFAPIITDDLLHIHVETVPLADDDTVPPVDEVQRIISEYEFTPAKGGTDGRAK
jgi:hypothetical protein